MNKSEIIQDCDNQVNRDRIAYNLGVIGFHFQDGGVFLSLRGGEYRHEKTPSNMTRNEHLFSMLKKLAFES